MKDEPPTLTVTEWVGIAGLLAYVFIAAYVLYVKHDLILVIPNHVQLSPETVQYRIGRHLLSIVHMPLLTSNETCASEDLLVQAWFEYHGFCNDGIYAFNVSNAIKAAWIYSCVVLIIVMSCIAIFLLYFSITLKKRTVLLVGAQLFAFSTTFTLPYFATSSMNDFLFRILGGKLDAPFQVPFWYVDDQLRMSEPFMLENTDDVRHLIMLALAITISDMFVCQTQNAVPPREEPSDDYVESV